MERPPTLSRPYTKIRFPSGNQTVEFEIDSRYQNLTHIGSGAYGFVAAADDTLTGRKVAIKAQLNIFHNLNDSKRILRELKLLLHFKKHENIIRLLDIMVNPPESKNFHTILIVTPLFQADVHRILSSKQQLTDQHSMYLIYQVLRGLKFIHSAKVLHRDLKPANLLVNSNCDLAICDFGLARGISNDCGNEEWEGEHQDGKKGKWHEDPKTLYVVTRYYRAPEILCDNMSYSWPADVWSTGCILAEIFARQPFFKGNSTKDQLRLIVGMLGSPSDEDLNAVAGNNQAAIKFVRDLGPVKGYSWSEIFPQMNPQAIELLSKMLQFNPAKRITVEDALAHPYLHPVHSVTPEPTCPKVFDFSWEHADYSHIIGAGASAAPASQGGSQRPHHPGVLHKKVQQYLFYNELMELRRMQSSVRKSGHSMG